MTRPLTPPWLQVHCHRLTWHSKMISSSTVTLLEGGNALGDSGRRAGVYLYQPTSTDIEHCDHMTSTSDITAVAVAIDHTGRGSLATLLAEATGLAINTLLVPRLQHLPDASPRALGALSRLGLTVITLPVFRRGASAWSRR